MSTGFGLNTNAFDISVAIGLRRLRGSVERKDRDAIFRDLQEVRSRHGDDVADECLRLTLVSAAWLRKELLASLPKNEQQMFAAEAFDSLANEIESAGLQIEDHIRVCDEGFALTKTALAAITARNAEIGSCDKPPITEEMCIDSLDGVGICRSPFVHPLSDIKQEDDEEWANAWTTASLMINVVHGWLGDEGDPEKATKFLQQLTFAGNPQIDFAKLIRRVRYHDGELMRLCSLVEQGLTNKIESNR